MLCIRSQWSVNYLAARAHHIRILRIVRCRLEPCKGMLAADLQHMHAAHPARRNTASDNVPVSVEQCVGPLSATSSTLLATSICQCAMRFTKATDGRLHRCLGIGRARTGDQHSSVGGEMPDVEHIHGSTLKEVGRLMSPLHQGSRLGRPPVFDVHHRRS